MKLLLSLLLLLPIFKGEAQGLYFEETVHFIQQKVECCSVPFSKSTSRKVAKIGIAKNGNITLSYPDKQPPQTFNLFELYQEEEGAIGIDTIMSGKFIQFYVNENRIRLIRFATAADAAE